MMAKVEKLTKPGPRHAWLERFLGSWDIELRVALPGAKPDKGQVAFSWLIEDRWLQMRGSGTMMGLPSDTFLVLGYDNFKQSTCRCRCPRWTLPCWSPRATSTRRPEHYCCTARSTSTSPGSTTRWSSTSGDFRVTAR
ncbi:MAG: DUF1579 family protein [Acidobacteriota bacterium]|nr:MAG: DUF1579 family protein [Acidobacteriota bacterium]